MAFFNVLKSKYSVIVAGIQYQHHVQRVSLHLLCATLPTKVTCCPTPSQSYMQTRSLKKRTPNTLRPLNFDYSEDLVGQGELDQNEILYKYKDIPEINELEPHVRKLLTVQYASGREKLEHRNMLAQKKMVDLVGPDSNYERQVVYLTVKIRNLIPTIINNRQNKKHKAHLVERIAKRKKILGYIRRLDYDRFLWLLKELKITYTPYNERDFFPPHKRAAFMQECRDVLYDTKSDKVAAIKQQVESEKTKFMTEKEKILQEIDAEIQEHGLDKEEILRTYQKHVEESRKGGHSTVKPKTGWKRMNKFVEMEKLEKEKAKWVF